MIAGWNITEKLNTLQITLLGVAALFAVVLLGILIYYIYLQICKPDLKNEIAMMDKLFDEEKKLLLADKRAADAEIKKSEKQMFAKEKEVEKLMSETEKMHQELLRQGAREEQAKEIAEMTLRQLVELKEKERRDLSGDFIINAITRKVLIDSEFEPRDDIKDFRVPVNKTMDFTQSNVAMFIERLPDVVSKKSASGRQTITYKALGKTFAILIPQSDDEYILTIKSGPFFGNRLMQLYPDLVSKTKFPHGMMWFDINRNGQNCSLELVKLLIIISYNIAKAGY